MVALTASLVVTGVLATAVGLVLASVAWRQRASGGARAYTALMVVLAAWSALYVGQLLGPTVAAKRPWLVARHAISPLVPVTFWLFATRYTDRRRLVSVRYLGPIVAVGAVLAPTPLVNPGGLYWRSLAVTSLGTAPVLDVTFGPLFWVMLAYIVAVVGVGHGLVVDMLVDSFSVYRRQLGAVAASGVVGFLLLALFLTDHVPAVPSANPLPNVQLLSYATVLVALPLGWSYYRDALFSVQPLAHRTVIGNMADAVVVLDTEGVVRKVNQPARALASESGDGADVVGAPFEAAFADRPALVRRFRALTDATERTDDGGQPVTLRVDGRRRHFDLRVSAIERAGDEPVGRVLAIRDVTTEATQRERLERKNEQLERLADVVSHDLRAPLSTAEKLVSLLATDLEDPDADVERALDDLTAVHDRLRVFAEELPRLARGGVDVEAREPCDVDRLASAAWALVDTGDIELVVEEAPTVSGDPHRLQRLFQNLFENVADHATASSDAAASDLAARRDGGPGGDGDRHDADGVGSAPTGRATEVRVGATDVGFFVADDGPGVPPPVRADLFEYGMSTGDGTGFGLAIVRTIVEAHGWSIDLCESESGGARFEVRTET